MNTLLMHPSPEPGRSAEDMLDELEELDDALRRKLETASAAARARYEWVLARKLGEARLLVSQNNSRARQTVEDAIVMFREAATTA